MSNAILLAPGPVQLHPEVQKILAEPMIHHRTPVFDQILKRVLQNLKFLFQTKNHVFIQSSTGSGAMESALVNTLSQGDEVLAIVSGKFGERWADMAETFGANVQRLHVEWGKSVDPQLVESHLQTHKKTKLVLCQACETSTATINDIKSLGMVVSQTAALLVVDGITAVGAYEMPMDDWGIDVLIAGSQKGVMLPTGLSFISLSEKAWAVSDSATCPRFYFDLHREFKANKNGETFFSSNVTLIKALDFVLNDMQKMGLDHHLKSLKRRADFTRQMAKNLRLSLYSQSPSDSVTALNLPDLIINTQKGVQFREHLEKKYGVTVMGGQDQAKGKIIRLGHMGYITDEDMINTVIAIAKTLKDFGVSANADEVQTTAQSWLKDNML